MYLDGISGEDIELQQRAVSLRLLRNLREAGRTNDQRRIDSRIRSLLRYFRSAYPGNKDPPDIQLIKGMSREWEAECVWSYFGWHSDQVHHLRLAFYKGDIFTEEPKARRDVPPILKLLKKTKPHIVSVTFDPEASGPDTHYKVMQAIHAALDEHSDGRVRPPRIWGYRNVWYHFHPSEANVFVPVSVGTFSLMNHTFMNAFASQKDASFPSHEHDGPFSELAQRFQVDKYRMLQTCLGDDWFRKHPNPSVRSAHGFAFMKEISLHEFFRHSRALRKVAENR